MNNFVCNTLRPIIELLILITIIVCTVITICDKPTNEPEIIVEESMIESTTEETNDELVEEPIKEIEFESSEDDTHYNVRYNLDANDSYILAKIAMAEAEGEDIEGKAYVIMVVLNRVNDDRFPDTIQEVVFAKNQFTPVSNGRYDRVEPNEDCYEALRMVMMDNWDKSQGALYFESQKNPDNWHNRNLEYLFTHGCHRFYK